MHNLQIWYIWTTIDNSRRCLPLMLTRKALRNVVQMLRVKGYTSIYPKKD